MSFVVYSKGESCKFCVLAKKLLDSAGYKYKENILDIHILKEDFIKKFPDVKTVPLIFDGEVRVGTYEDLVEYIKTKGPAPELLEG